ncbi:MAG TPA: DUF2140 domain-containing protein [Anaerolinea thermolimosa]|uniref:DUF2140 domain-containing protein n=1 Tax=Anaerolinea thermolimosa TaxID=229919 RepID=A0A3D1JH27_9CHLR|nr:DUF2140 family protein [Anaerolinea thermolimosa]GAP06275.1 uncharacterized protein conserved in bacteria [Anaerolinea thermolimosa]HCE17881.1 DUF2140 domain-containing protein [Anaerolinea thermolimosa]
MKPILFLSVLLLSTGLACSLPIRTAQPPSTTIIASGEAAAELESNVATAVAQLEQTGTASLTITENQLTSYLAEKLASQPDSPIQNAQVRLENGSIQLTGQMSVSSLTTDLSLTMQPYIDQGNLQVTIQDGKIGSLPIPDATLKTLTQTINQEMPGLVTFHGQQFKLESITMENGSMTLKGMLP